MSSRSQTGARDPLRFIVLQPGARMHYAVPALLARAGMLERFYTDICADVGLASSPGAPVAGADATQARRASVGATAAARDPCPQRCDRFPSRHSHTWRCAVSRTGSATSTAGPGLITV